MFKWTSMIKMTRTPSKSRDPMDQYFNSFIDELFTSVQGADCFSSSFKVDIFEDEKNYVLEAELPGYDESDVKITYLDNYLTISVNQMEKERESKLRVIRKERTEGQFSRSFAISQIEEDQIKAKMNCGILRLHIPKKPL